MTITFFLLVSIVFYTYFGYGMMITIFNLFKKNDEIKVDEVKNWPSVSFIVACYNEQKFVKDKFNNCENLDYPGKLNFIWITDGSSDQTNKILGDLIGGNENHQLLWEPARKGKTAALNRAVKNSTGEILVFSDCNTKLNSDCLIHLCKHYADPKVGGTSGTKIVDGEGEGLYWKYENFLKIQDSKFYSQVGAPGELFTVRSDLYKFPKEDTILDDFMITMKIVSMGYKVKHVQDAYALENGVKNPVNEWVRKKRISSGGAQSIHRLSQLLSPFFLDFRVWWQYMSHRVFRWTIAPASLFASMILVYFLPNNTLYILFKFSYTTFIIFSLLGFIKYKIYRKSSIFGPFFYFLMMNFSVFVGWKNYLLNNENLHIWKKAKR